MAKFIIQGNKSLSGSISVSGAKNAALPIIAASLLTDKTCRINNVPDILDIKIMLEIIQAMGARVERDEDTLEIAADKINIDQLPKDLFNKLRASVLLLGPMLGRIGQAKLGYPGGCIIGKRPIDIHLEAVRSLGGNVKENQNYFEAELSDQIKSNQIYLREASVTGTENLMMMAASRNATTKIERAACEPHISNLAEMLNKMGAEIKGQGTNRLAIKGTNNLNGAEIDIVPDTIEVGSFAALALAAKAQIKINNVNKREDLYPILNYLDRINANYDYDENKRTLSFSKKQDLVSADIKTEIWPGFPTDVQPPFTVLATQTKGTTLIHETIFDQRLYYIDQLTNMGAKIIQCDPHRVVVAGPSNLKGSKIISPDIRAGMAMIIAGIIAEGKTEIDNIELIERGYEKIGKRLAEIGAQIKRSENV
jgi:UDP-N-acetylglucosamine 1-carboxyvinyltransferase